MGRQESSSMHTYCSIGFSSLLVRLAVCIAHHLLQGRTKPLLLPEALDWEARAVLMAPVTATDTPSPVRALVS